MRQRDDLSRPAGGLSLGVHYDPDAFGRFSESIARYFGTGRYLVIQTGIVILWILVNVGAAALRFDPYPFILLNLLFSTQAAYAAPLILLAQNRQDARDRAQASSDRATTARIMADTEYLARELAAIRLHLSTLATAEDVAERVDRLHQSLGDVVRAAGEGPDELAALVDDERFGGVLGDVDDRAADRDPDRAHDHDPDDDRWGGDDVDGGPDGGPAAAGSAGPDDDGDPGHDPPDR